MDDLASDLDPTDKVRAAKDTNVDVPAKAGDMLELAVRSLHVRSGCEPERTVSGSGF